MVELPVDGGHGMSLSWWWEVIPPSLAGSNGWIKSAIQEKVRHVAYYPLGPGEPLRSEKTWIIKIEHWDW